MDTDNTKRIVLVNTYRIARRDILSHMSGAEERLVMARRAAGYATAADAARAMGISEAAYTHHENGTRGLSRSGARYARFFHVGLEWLLTGKGEMRARGGSIPIMGIATAGSAAIPSAEDEAHAALGFATLPDPDEVFAQRVEGDSMWPRFLHGETIICGRAAQRPDRLIGRYALVQLPDGRRMIKLLARGGRPGRYTLESHNAPAEHDIEVLAAWPYLMTLA
jgi:phage repressor protein C with HTH and peptisase S24 domain